MAIRSACDQLLHYLRRDPAAELFLFEMGFRLALPGGKVSIRKPDLVLRDNPVQARDRDNRYRGIPDLLIEALSDRELTWLWTSQHSGFLD